MSTYAIRWRLRERRNFAALGQKNRFDSKRPTFPPNARPFDGIVGRIGLKYQTDPEADRWRGELKSVLRDAAPNWCSTSHRYTCRGLRGPGRRRQRSAPR